MRFALAAFSRMAAGLFLCLAVLLSAESNPVVGQPVPKAGELPPINQAAIDESIARAVEYMKATQKDDGTWDDHFGYTCLGAIALIESGIRLNDTAIARAAAHVRSKASALNDTYQMSLAILFLDKLKDPKRDDPLIQSLAARLMAGQTATGGWAYEVSGGARMMPRLTETETKDMIAALKKMTPPPATISVSYRERPSRMGLCIKQSEEIIVKPSLASLNDAEYEKKRAAAIKGLTANLKRIPMFKDPASYETMDPVEKKAFFEREKGDNSNTHFAMVGLWTARRHGVPTEQSFTLVARRFRQSQDPSAGGWGYSYPQNGSTNAMTCVALLGLAIGNALAVDPAAGRPEQDKAILNSLNFLSKNVGMPTGKFTDRPKVKDAGGLYYFWALERIAVLYDIRTLDKKDWYRWGAEILVCNQLADGSWTDGGFPGGEKPAVCTPLAILFLKRANLTPDLSKRLIIDSSALTAKVNEPAPPPPPPPPPPPKVETPTVVEPPPKKEEPPPVVTPPKVTPPPSEPAVVKKESAPIWPWLAGGIGLIAMIGLGLFFVMRKKSDDDEDEDDEDDDDEEKPKKKVKKTAKASKAAKSIKAKKAKD